MAATGEWLGNNWEYLAGGEQHRCVGAGPRGNGVEHQCALLTEDKKAVKAV